MTGEKKKRNNGTADMKAEDTGQKNRKKTDRNGGKRVGVNLEDLQNAGIAGAAFETVARHGSAIKEHLVAYTGVDNETGRTLVKGLKGLAESKVNPDYEFQNLHQQAGFAAEIKEVARSNEESILKGSSTRTIRTDDLGRVNDPLYDTVKLDAGGNIIEGSGRQVKFVGASASDPSGAGDAARAADKLLSGKYQKYVENDVGFTVPQDQHAGILAELERKKESYMEQAAHLRAAGNTEQAAKIQERIDYIDKVEKQTYPSKVTGDEALFARTHPMLSTMKDTMGVAHEAGMEMAEFGAAIGGGVAVIRNLMAVCNGEMDEAEALRNMVKETAVTTGASYAVGFGGTVIKGLAQNSASGMLHSFSKSNLPAAMVRFAIDGGKTMVRYLNGEIDGLACLQTLGQQGANMASTATFAAIGQVVIPVPVVGGLVGSMVGYTLSATCYGILVDSLERERKAREHRIQVEKACQEYIRIMRESRVRMEAIIHEYLEEYENVFEESFAGLKDALAIGDVDLYIESTNNIREKFDSKAVFRDKEDFDRMMDSDEPFRF